MVGTRAKKNTRSKTKCGGKAVHKGEEEDNGISGTNNTKTKKRETEETDKQKSSGSELVEVKIEKDDSSNENVSSSLDDAGGVGKSKCIGNKMYDICLVGDHDRVLETVLFSEVEATLESLMKEDEELCHSDFMITPSTKGSKRKFRNNHDKAAGHNDNVRKAKRVLEFQSENKTEKVSS